MSVRVEVLVEVDPDTGEEWTTINKYDEDGNLVSTEIE